MHALEVEEQRVALGVVAEAVGEPQVEQRVLELHRLVAEDARVHRRAARDDRAEVHVREDVALDVDAGRHLDQLHALGVRAEHAALGDVEHRLAASRAA